MCERWQQVMYWAVDAAGCCLEGAKATCDGWDQEDFQGINWYKQERPATVFLSHKHLGTDITSISEMIKKNGGASNTAPVVVQWRKNAATGVGVHFDAPAWAWLAVVTLLWPLVLCLLFTAVTLGSCLFLPRSSSRHQFSLSLVPTH
jgi:hypothetical protein